MQHSWTNRTCFDADGFSCNHLLPSYHPTWMRNIQKKIYKSYLSFFFIISLTNFSIWNSPVYSQQRASRDSLYYRCTPDHHRCHANTVEKFAGLHLWKSESGQLLLLLSSSLPRPSMEGFPIRLYSLQLAMVCKNIFVALIEHQGDNFFLLKYARHSKNKCCAYRWRVRIVNVSH